MTKGLLPTALLAILMIALPALAAAQGRTPELVDGKTTVFQRILTKPGARLTEGPGGAEIRRMVPFQPYYIYGREGDSIEVGRSRRQGPEGWVSEDRTIRWDQNLVVAFASLAGRERQFMFESRDALMDIVNHESPIGMARQLRQQVEETGAGDGVVTIEPSETVDITRNFYLLPILDYSVEEHPMTFSQMNTLKIASLPLRDEEPEEPGEEEPPTVGLVFVIDTTRSMQPYIDETRSAVRSIISRIQSAGIASRIRFGIVGFRDSPEAALAADPTRDIEYRTNTYLDLTPDQNPGNVLSAFFRVSEADDSTVHFHEDSVAGVMQALEMPGWENAGPDGEPLQQRWVIVITDASPKPASDPNAAYRMDTEAVRIEAEERNIGLVAMHIKTPDGRPNHRAAQASYTALTQRSTTDPAYYPIDVVDANADIRAVFGTVVEEVSSFITEEVRITTAELQERQRDGGLNALEEASLAMRLAWLGRQRNTGAPDVIEAWTLDYTLEDPTIPSLDVRLLVTKNQLATMSDVLQEVVDLGESGGGDQGNFFRSLRGAFARLSQDPDNLVNEDFETLDQAIGEFLEDLPYQSPLLGITQEQWNRMGSRRRTILDRVRSRLQLYTHFHNNPAVWTALFDGQENGEHVFAMPFEALP
ncbi:MAG: vWA domain-containing protein [Pseudomonadota bacterium]